MPVLRVEIVTERLWDVLRQMAAGGCAGVAVSDDAGAAVASAGAAVPHAQPPGVPHRHPQPSPLPRRLRERDPLAACCRGRGFPARARLFQAVQTRSAVPNECIPVRFENVALMGGEMVLQGLTTRPRCWRCPRRGTCKCSMRPRESSCRMWCWHEVTST
eukprot:263977-Rhodomonas_salina.5